MEQEKEQMGIIEQIQLLTLKIQQQEKSLKIPPGPKLRAAIDEFLESLDYKPMANGFAIKARRHSSGWQFYQENISKIIPNKITPEAYDGNKLDINRIDWDLERHIEINDHVHDHYKRLLSTLNTQPPIGKALIISTIGDDHDYHKAIMDGVGMWNDKVDEDNQLYRVFIPASEYIKQEREKFMDEPETETYIRKTPGLKSEQVDSFRIPSHRIPNRGPSLMQIAIMAQLHRKSAIIYPTEQDAETMMEKIKAVVEYYPLFNHINTLKNLDITDKEDSRPFHAKIGNKKGGSKNKKGGRKF